jgi:hypothetical protein
MDAPFVGALAPPFLLTSLPLPERLLATIAAGWACSLYDDPRPAIAPDQRVYDRLLRCDDYDVWVIHWGPHSGIDAHDHAGSAGALHVVRGELVEHHHDPHVMPVVRRRLRVHRSRTFPVGHVHEVHNVGPRVATSIHVYSPPLTDMTFYREPPPLTERHVPFRLSPDLTSGLPSHDDQRRLTPSLLSGTGGAEQMEQQ